MKRRSFIQSLLAVPIVAAVAKFAPTKAEPPPLTFHGAEIPTEEYRPIATPLTGRKHDPPYAWYEAGAPIRKGFLLQFIPKTKTVMPMTANTRLCCFAGVAMHDAMAGDTITVGTEGTFAVRFK